MAECQLILPRSDIMLSATSEVDQIIKPLRQYGLHFLSHSRVYNDGTFIDISNNPGMIQHFYYDSDEYKDYTPEVQPEALGEGLYLTKSLGCDDCVRVLQGLAVDNVMVYIEKHHNHYEIWNIGGKLGDNSIINFYFNNLDFIKMLTYYFKEKAYDLINRYEADKIKRFIPKEHILNQVIPELSNPMSGHSIFEELSNSIQRYYISKEVYLTKKEVLVLRYVVEGLSAKEIGRRLNISSKTVEFHILSCKKKLNVSSRSELVRSAKRLLYFINHKI